MDSPSSNQCDNQCDNQSPLSSYKIDYVQNLSICSYNLLAQSLISREWFPWAQRTALRWNNRQVLFEAQIKQIAADVFSFQEMDVAQYMAFWDPFLTSLGYTLFFSTPLIKAKHGICLAYKTDKFVEFTRHTVHYEYLQYVVGNVVFGKESFAGSPKLAQILVLLPIAALHSTNNNTNIINQQDACQLSIPLLFFTNNHLDWRFYLNSVKFRQLLLLRHTIAVLQHHTPSFIMINSQINLNNELEEYQQSINSSITKIAQNDIAGVKTTSTSTSPLFSSITIPSFSTTMIDNKLVQFIYSPPPNSSPTSTMPFPFNTSLNSISAFSCSSQPSTISQPAISTITQPAISIPFTKIVISTGDFNLTCKTTCLPFHQTHMWPAILPTYPVAGKLQKIMLRVKSPLDISSLYKNYQNAPQIDPQMLEKLMNRKKIPVLQYNGEPLEKECYLHKTATRSLVQYGFNEDLHVETVQYPDHQPPFYLVAEPQQILSPAKLLELQQISQNNQNPQQGKQNQLKAQSNQTSNQAQKNENLEQLTSPLQQPPLIIQKSYQPNTDVALLQADHATITLTPFNSSSCVNSSTQLTSNSIVPKSSIYQQIDAQFKYLRENYTFSPYVALYTPLHSIVFLIQLAILKTSVNFVPVQHIPKNVETTVPFDFPANFSLSSHNPLNPVLQHDSFEREILFDYSSVAEDTINTFPRYLVDSVQHWFSTKFASTQPPTASFLQNKSDSTQNGTENDVKTFEQWVIFQIEAIYDTELAKLHKVRDLSDSSFEPALNLEKNNLDENDQDNGSATPISLLITPTSPVATVVAPKKGYKKTNSKTPVEPTPALISFPLELYDLDLYQLYLEQCGVAKAKAHEFYALLVWLCETMDFLKLNITNTPSPASLSQSMTLSSSFTSMMSSNAKSAAPSLCDLNSSLMITGGSDLLVSLLNTPNSTDYATLALLCEKKAAEFISRFDFYWSVECVPTLSLETILPVLQNISLCNSFNRDDSIVNATTMVAHHDNNQIQKNTMISITPPLSRSSSRSSSINIELHNEQNDDTTISSPLSYHFQYLHPTAINDLAPAPNPITEPQNSVSSIIVNTGKRKVRLSNSNIADNINLNQNNNSLLCTLQQPFSIDISLHQLIEIISNSQPRTDDGTMKPIRVRVLFDLNSSTLTIDNIIQSLSTYFLDFSLVSTGVRDNANVIHQTHSNIETNIETNANANNMNTHQCALSPPLNLPQPISKHVCTDQVGTMNDHTNFLPQNTTSNNAILRSTYVVPIDPRVAQNGLQTDQSVSNHNNSKYIHLTQCYIQSLTDLLILSLPNNVSPFIDLINHLSIVSTNTQHLDDFMNLYQQTAQYPSAPRFQSGYANYPFLPSPVPSAMTHHLSDLNCGNNENSTMQAAINSFINPNNTPNNFSSNTHYHDANLTNINYFFSHSLAQSLFSTNTSSCSSMAPIQSTKIVICQYCLPTISTLFSTQFPFSLSLSQLHPLFEYNPALCTCQSLQKGLPLSNHNLNWSGVLDHILVSSPAPFKASKVENSSQQIAKPIYSKIESLRVVETRDYVCQEGSLPSTFYPSDHLPIRCQVSFKP